MTTMPIDNHPLAQIRLQFIGISANKLTPKSIDIIHRQTTTIMSLLEPKHSSYENPGYIV